MPSASIINPLPALMNTGNPFYHPMMPGGLNMAGGLQDTFGKWQEQKRYDTEQAQQEYENVFAEKELGQKTRYQDSYTDYLHKSLGYKQKEMSAASAKLAHRTAVAQRMVEKQTWSQDQGDMYIDDEWVPDITEDDYELDPELAGDIDSFMGWTPGAYAKSPKLVQKEAMETYFDVKGAWKKPQTKENKDPYTPTNKINALRNAGKDVLSVFENVKGLKATPEYRKRIRAKYGVDPAMPLQYNALMQVRLQSKAFLDEADLLYIDKAEKTRRMVEKLHDNPKFQAWPDEKKVERLEFMLNLVEEEGMDEDVLNQLWRYLIEEESTMK